MSDPMTFVYSMRDPTMGSASLAPMLPLIFEANNQVSALALLDSGATVSVMPFALGGQLGFHWEEQTRAISLSGNLGRTPARVITVSAQVGEFPAVRLAFARTKTDASPLILGQVNFFMEFDVCFSVRANRLKCAPNRSFKTFRFSLIARPNARLLSFNRLPTTGIQ